MIKSFIHYIGIAALSLSPLFTIQAQDFTSDDYDKALWMTTRFFGAQRSTDINHAELQDNWILQDYLPSGVPANKTGISFAQDADAGYDLSGGWFDCGDHVFFGQTGFYAGYMLLKAYDAFPEGYDDYYDEAYSGYRSSGDYSWEGGKGSPNGIPDVLDEAKHQTDLFIKMAKNSTTFYYEKGQGNYDHMERITSVKMQTNPVSTGGELRKMWSNPNGASMASMCSATLALMSRLYRPFDEAYADLCLVHAKYAYDYASSKTGAVGAASGSFYNGNDNWQNGKAIMLAEMYMATGQATYKSQADAMSTDSGNGGDVHPNAGYTFDYSNTGEIALYALAEIGHSTALGHFNTRINNSFIAGTNYNGQGAYKNGGGWGKLRYVGNAALLVALYDQINGNTTLNDKVYSNVDYILGSNSGNRSYIVGMEASGKTAPTQPHHRNAFHYEGNNNNEVVQMPAKNQQFGALVGGALDGSYADVWTEYVNTEVCVDYNVGIVGALGAIKSRLAAVDTSKFYAGVTPELGDDVSLCGSTSVLLDANVPADGVITFEWFKDDVRVAGPSKTKTTYSATSGGTFKVVIDSLGEWSTSDKVDVIDYLPAVDLGADFELCDPASQTLNAGISGNGINYIWSKGGSTVGEEASYEVRSAGTYTLTVSASGCSDVSDQVTATSLLPDVQDGYSCGSAETLEILNGTGSYVWYNQAEGGSQLGTGSTYTTDIVGTYYVEDESSFSLTIGPDSDNHSFQNQNGNNGGNQETELTFEVVESLTLNALTIYVKSWGSESGSIDIKVKGGSSISGFPMNYTETNGSNGSIEKVRLALNASLAPGEYVMTAKAVNYFNAGDNFYPQNLNDLIVLTDNNSSYNQWNNPNNYGGYFDWEVTAGNACARIPVKLFDDCVTSIGAIEYEEDQLLVYPNPFNTETIIVLEEGAYQVEVLSTNGELIDNFNYTGSELTVGNNLNKGVYLVKISSATASRTVKIVKQ